eukprot:CAMPEP_0178951616 /NCGR_PEP_ID=MMETSP0789-20121207/7331_1 /TAXON_ID=3005 /ORGANISM="Rhizosolenia setigera, Strain CCMP 1694" /LENGTH=204 /DNA_ID=CAMNT_0020632521 /DNA_START=1 /DNA_END=615 /DNA_ORIENTATION=-
MAMKTAIVEELQELIAIEKEAENSMDKAQKACEDLIKEQEYQAALERGEKFAPDGRPIPENQNIEIRPLDPRFNPAFGNPFFRVNNIEKKEDEAISELSEAELEFFNSLEDEDLLLEADDEGLDFGDTYDQFVVSEEKPRGRCGLDVQDAIDTCGSACDPDIESCLITNKHGSTYNQLNINGQWFVQGTCFPELFFRRRSTSNS